MGALMRQHAVVVHSIWELIETRHVDCLWCGGIVVRTIPAVSDLDSHAMEKPVRMFDSLVLGEFWFKPFREFASVHLFDVENGVALGE